MKVEPVIDKTALVETVRREYGLRIESLDFFPAGWVAYCYVANYAEGERYFLKLYDISGQALSCASDLDFYLPLTYQLCAKGILPHIACPCKTRTGSLTARVGDFLLILFHFIEGKLVGQAGMSDEIIAQLARLLGILHKSTAAIEMEDPLQERFDFIFENDLVHSLAALEAITSGDRSGKQRLRDLLLPRKNEILGYLQRLKELQALAKAAEKEMVVCHTDLHGGNLMVDDEGNLYILDWEGAMIAPPEQDLFFFASEDRFWNLFLPNYEREFGLVSLDGNVFGFYYYRRNLEDLTGWVVRILRYSSNDEQDREDLQGIVEDCMSGWPYLETTIGKIEARLAKRKDNSI